MEAPININQTANPSSAPNPTDDANLIKATSYTHEAYASTAPFVPLLTSRLTTLLSPSPTDRIIDLGAGNLTLTSTLSRHVSHILALDASEELLSAGRIQYPLVTYPNLDTRVLDCRFLMWDGAADGTWDAVFSNAALHWILRDEGTRHSVIAGVHDCLKNGGRFVAEMGGFGNIAELHTALTASLHHHGVSLENIKKANPWWFPSEVEMRTLLESAGFDVQVIETEWRPTELPGGVGDWFSMFAVRLLELVEEGRRSSVVDMASRMVEGAARRGDGVWVAGYVRLRWVAVKR
ncbi:hypothetical protein Dda_4974 [Drechslerella dactyloides]|uniref:Methyltransferase type 11 domain-containing protein n=1 Tax=Drechslerella dactyloides TaxID=74499 RepID=A0AAD6J065_DREDA|nr:hypothetical protein Dda_4974 [Drechslerella dactyloides]